MLLKFHVRHSETGLESDGTLRKLPAGSQCRRHRLLFVAYSHFLGKPCYFSETSHIFPMFLPEPRTPTLPGHVAGEWAREVTPPEQPSPVLIGVGR